LCVCVYVYARAFVCMNVCIYMHTQMDVGVRAWGTSDPSLPVGT